MCCLFGLIDYQKTLSAAQRNRILSVLATACEARGTDTTGIAYNSQDRMRIYKRPLPGRRMRFHLPEDAHVIMGHTRMTTQGSEKKNINNHPFGGTTGEGTFALAHNGVIRNDRTLRRTLALPKTKIETDSFIGVQLIEQRQTLSFDSLCYMAEQLDGSFTFTVLDAESNLYIIKGDNPMCLYHFPRCGIYLYASTEAILNQALRQLRLPLERPTQIHIDCGEILKIDCAGAIARSQFDDSKLFCGWYDPLWFYGETNRTASRRPNTQSYLEEIKSVATAFGYSPEDIETLSAQGFSPEELEELLYCGEL